MKRRFFLVTSIHGEPTSNHRSSFEWRLAGDNRFMNTKSPYERILMAPRCRLIIYSVPVVKNAGQQCLVPPVFWWMPPHCQMDCGLRRLVVNCKIITDHWASYSHLHLRTLRASSMKLVCWCEGIFWKRTLLPGWVLFRRNLVTRRILS